MEENMFRGILLQQINRNCEIEISDESLTSEQLCITYAIERLLQNHSVLDGKKPYAFMGNTMDYVLDNAEWLLNSDISLQLRARIHDIITVVFVLQQAFLHLNWKHGFVL